MKADSLSQFTQALKHCASCGSQCTATLPRTELTRLVEEVASELVPTQWGEAIRTLPLGSAHCLKRDLSERSAEVNYRRTPGRGHLPAGWVAPQSVPGI